jgi:hypothetical protein
VNSESWPSRVIVRPWNYKTIGDDDDDDNGEINHLSLSNKAVIDYSVSLTDRPILSDFQLPRGNSNIDVEIQIKSMNQADDASSDNVMFVDDCIGSVDKTVVSASLSGNSADNILLPVSSMIEKAD